MCGITGVLDTGARSSLAEAVSSMTEQLAHRGPDDAGIWVDQDAGVALGHRRLSIVDLSSAGHQPMGSPDKRYWLSYNGELYNHQELRNELAGYKAAPSWRGHSDTETLLAVLAHWGVPEGLERLNGMFALALWDRAEEILYLARDRMGEKPLYYGEFSGAVVFASELSALKVHPKWQGNVDPTDLSLFLRFGYVPSPWSIYEGISKLPPAHYLAVKRGEKLNQVPKPYWTLADTAMDAAGMKTRSPRETVASLNELLEDAVQRRMRADVPVGSFLSGGIDSSTITALMQAHSSKPVKTFTIGFREEGFNEANHAKAIARHLGTDHTELYLEPGEALSTVPRLPETWDEPFADPSQIPTLLVSQLAREQVKVVLSGDGGDELLYGYARYTLAHRLWVVNRLLPRALRPILNRLVSRFPASGLDQLLASLTRTSRMKPIGPRLTKLGVLVSEYSRSGFYEQFVSHWNEPETAMIASDPHSTLIRDIDKSWLPRLQEMMMWVDTHLYLPDDILVKVDRASMAFGLETRIPLLDHRIVELMWRTPLNHKVRQGVAKWPLRQILNRYVPRELFERPKMGFGIPIEEWLGGPLRDWADELLSSDNLRKSGFLEVQTIRRLWEAQSQGLGRYHYQLWNVLMFQAWLRANR